MDISKEWLEKRAALEADLEVGAGFSIVSPTPADIAKMERLIFEGLPKWAQREVAALRRTVELADAIRAAQRAYMADRGNEALGRAVGEACEAYDAQRVQGNASDGAP